MVQFLNDNEKAIGKEFHSILSPLWGVRKTGLMQFKNKAYTTGNFINVIGNYSDIRNYLTEEQWQLVAHYIFENADKVGTYNFYIDVFKLIFGTNAGIDFNLTNPAPGVLGITITYDATEEENRVTTETQQRVTTTDENRVVSQVTHLLTLENIRGILSKIVPGGIHTNITITIM